MAAVASAGSPVASVVRVDQRTGKLVRSVVGNPKTQVVPKEARAAVDATVRNAAERHGLSPDLLHSVIRVESNYNPYAISSKGALGLMQLIPSTARRFGVANAFDPAESIEGGAKYLRYLLDYFAGDQVLALAAYNAGEGAVLKYGGVPPYPETRNYVTQVSKQMAAQAAETPGTAPNETKPADVAAVRIYRVVEPDGTFRFISQ
jgi:soluble lytic murein transglycosylase-like protein